MAEPNATRADIARLFGRAAFGATVAELDQWTGKPYADAVESLLTPPESSPVDELAAEGYRNAFQASLDVNSCQQWWLERMRSALWPLRERMTLLWHNHFATAVTGENRPSAYMLMQQTHTLRLHALGNFRDMVAAMNVDEAMLHWLNGAQSAPPKPNENYAREFFELFTLGKSPQVYTEGDIREAARAFTGWNPSGTTGSFDPNRHDHDSKRVLGVVVPDLAEREHLELVRIALAQPVAYRFVAWKLVVGLAYLPPPTDLLATPDPLVRKVADTLQATGWDITAAVRTLLLSDEFRRGEPHLHRQHVRQPVQQVVHACRAFGISADLAATRQLCMRMGQELFRPPNVGGWPVGTSWLSPATMTAHYDLAFHVLKQWTETVIPRAAVAPASPADIDGWAAMLGLPGVSALTRSTIEKCIASQPDTADAQVRQSVVALLLASPEWMVL